MARGLIGLLAITSVSVACGGDGLVLDDSAIEAAVGDAVEAEVGEFSLACSDLETLAPEIGGQRRCVVTVGDGSGLVLDVDVNVAPAVDGAIAVSAAVVTPLFDLEAAQRAVAARLDADLGGDPAVRCDSTVVVPLEPGLRVGCRVTAEGGTAGPVDRALTIVILDADGNFEVDFTP